MENCCANCIYYDTDRQDQPCCSCVCGCNFESDVHNLLKELVGEYK